jgi:hypothetical protein
MTITPDFVETPTLPDAIVALDAALDDAISVAEEAVDAESEKGADADEELIVACENIVSIGTELKDYVYNYLALIYN